MSKETLVQHKVCQLLRRRMSRKGSYLEGVVRKKKCGRVCKEDIDNFNSYQDLVVKLCKRGEVSKAVRGTLDAMELAHRVEKVVK